MSDVNPAVMSAPPGDRKLVLAERNDLGLAWITAVLLGVGVISLVPEQSGGIRVFLPLVFMAGFLLFAMTRERYSTPKVADSVYFMGFIWTLWALIDVLIGKPQLRASELYVAFGYALTATTGGMFLRLVILQFYRTLEDQEMQAVDSIDERLARLTKELEASHPNY